MICKHCGHDVPEGILYCTACGEPMPQTDTPAKPVKDEGPGPRLSQKEFSKQYLPHGIKLTIHTGAFISYIFSAYYLVIGALSLLGQKPDFHTILLLGAFGLMIVLTLCFEIKKSFPCAVVFTVIAAALAVYFLVAYETLMVIWVCGGVLGIYGTRQYQKHWKTYQETGKLPRRAN